MRHSIENEFLIVTVDTLGAELVSVVDRATGAEMMWQADPEVWGRHAPILFPYCGRLKDGQYTLDGQVYQGGQHGFARDMEHEPVRTEKGIMTFVLRSNEETRKKLPRDFEMETTFVLHGRTLRQNVKVKNTGDKELRFGLGYHPGFAIPFDDVHTTEDYELRFDKAQTPLVIETGATSGLVTGETRVMMQKGKTIALNDRMFDVDSTCMGQLNANSLSIVEKKSGKQITVGIKGFPYTLIWSAAGNPNLKFICIEPWHTLPDREDADGDWNHKPCAQQLQPGQEWESHLDMTFAR